MKTSMLLIKTLEDIYENVDPSHTQQHPMSGAAGEPEEFEAIKKGYEQYITSRQKFKINYILGTR